MTLQEFFEKNKSIDFCIRADKLTEDGCPCFYIYPEGLDGDTVDFFVKDNRLFELTPDIKTVGK